MPSATPRFALVTYADDPALTADDQLLADAFVRASAAVDAVPWERGDADWAGYDAVVLRSPWNYFLVPDRFRAWLDAREADGTRLLNPVAAVRWNLDKRYLRALAACGAATIPTRWVEPGAGSPFGTASSGASSAGSSGGSGGVDGADGVRSEAPSLGALLAGAGWDDAVVKPAVSGGAHETWRTSRAHAAADEARFRALAARGALLVQPFVREVVDDGEWSLLFYGGAYSHAARKRPAAGDFRVQVQFGGVYTGEPAPPGAESDAARIVADAASLIGLEPADLAYARVDGCMIGGRFHLMELEIIEPALFLAQLPGAADRCAAALLDAAARLNLGSVR